MYFVQIIDVLDIPKANIFSNLAPGGTESYDYGNWYGFGTIDSQRILDEILLEAP